MNGAGQTAAGGVGGAQAATSRPASVPAIAINQETMQPTPTTTSVVGGVLQKGLSGFGDLMGKMGSAGVPGVKMPSSAVSSGRVASYALPAAGDPFASSLQQLDPNLLKALMAQRG